MGGFEGRLHDRGQVLADDVQVLGQIVLVVFCATNGVAGGNRYCPDLKAAIRA